MVKASLGGADETVPYAAGAASLCGWQCQAAKREHVCLRGTLTSDAGGGCAVCSVSGGRVDGRFDVHHRRPVDCLQGVDFNP
jgi:hypothetical protein